jgi:hypothetical protein
MSKDGKYTQYRQAKRGHIMDKGRNGNGMEIFTLGDTRISPGLKERSISCNRMAFTHSFMSSMMKKRMR